MLATKVRQGRRAEIQASDASKASAAHAAEVSSAAESRQAAASDLATDTESGSFLVQQLTTATPQTLRVCNAYAYPASLTLQFVRTKEELGALRYKECDDYNLLIQEGDEIDFKAKNSFVGTFAVSGLPSGGAGVLLLIASRRHSEGSHSMSATFTSHAFSALPPSSPSAQVAVIDTFFGPHSALAKLTIKDATGVNATRAPEEIPLNSVVSVAPGLYQLALPDPSGAMGPMGMVDVKPQRSYVVVRCGRDEQFQVGGENGNLLLAKSRRPYPEDLMIFPRTGQYSGASRFAASVSVAVLITAVGVWLEDVHASGPHGSQAEVSVSYS